MKHLYITSIPASEQLQWLNQPASEAFIDKPSLPGWLIVVLTAIGVFIVSACIFFLITWIFSGENPIETIDTMFSTDIEGYFNRKSIKRELTKFKHGDISPLLKRCSRYVYSPDFLLYTFDVPSGVSQQEIFDFNLALLKYWVMQKADATWENISHCICYNKDVLWKLFSHTSEEDPIIVPNELTKALLNRKEDFYNGLRASMNIKAYSRKWTLLWHSAEAGNNDAKVLLDWLDEQLAQGGKEAC